MKKIIALVIVLMTAVTVGLARQQLPVKISRQYSNKPLTEVLQDLQAAYGVNFYYINQDVSPIAITTSFKDQPIDRVLRTILTGTGLDFKVQSPGRFIIYKRNTRQSKPVKPVKAPVPTDTVRKDTAGRFNTELPAVEVTPGSYDIQMSGQSPQSLTKKEILYSPNLAKDIMRTMRVIPGVASNDFSAKPRIRGGATDETAVYLDNFEILAPYHFEEIDGFFSIINTDYVNNMKLIPGGFSANYTDKLSGIIDIKTPARVDSSGLSVSFDLVNATIFWKQKLSDKTDLQFSARRTYVDFLLSSEGGTDSQVKPAYYDFWAKFNYRLNSNNQLSFNLLHALDIFKVNVRDGYFNWLGYDGNQNNSFAWSTWRYTSSGRYRQITTLGVQRLAKRADFKYNNTISNENVDDRLNNVIVFAHNSYIAAGRHNIEFGGELKRFHAHFTFREVRFNEMLSEKDSIVKDSIDVNTRPSATTGALFLQDTYKLTDNLSVTAGLRLSYFSTLHAPWLFSPRFAIGYRINDHLSVKAGYGMYNQAIYLPNTRSFDGQEQPPDQHKQSEQYIANITWSKRGNTLQANAYYKNNRKLIDDYQYDIFNRVGGGVTILDRAFVTNSGYSKGIELTGRHAYGNRSSVMVSYAYAINKISNAAGEITWRDNDRRHTFSINNVLNLGCNWTFSAFTLFFSGEPYTPTQVKFVEANNDHAVMFYSFEKKNSRRLPGFFTLDVKFDKVWYFKKWGLNVYLNLINLTSHNNVRNYFWEVKGYNSGNVRINQETETYLANLFISPGISFSF
jgi:hypothetical protein